MRGAFPMLALGVALAVTCSSPGSARAEAPPAAPAAAQPDRGDADAAFAFGGSEPVADGLLDAQRGGADSHLSEIHAGGTVSDVTVSDVLTGYNMITEGALAGASGVPMFIQNTGNGVLIQNAVIVNVEVR